MGLTRMRRKIRVLQRDGYVVNVAALRSEQVLIVFLSHRPVLHGQTKILPALLPVE